MMPLLNEPKGLASLPNEILLEIFLEKVLTETDLFSLALVSRRFSRLVPVSLYDSIGCRIDHDKVTSNTTCELQKTRTMDNLLRNLHAHPDLGTLVRDLTLEFGERTEGEVVMLLKSLPALRSLILSHRNPCSRDRILDLSDVPMLSLRNFHVWTVHLNAEDVVRFMLLPNIRKLRGLLQARPNDPVIELAGLAGKSSLKSLRLNSNEPHVAMRELLAVPEALEHFHQYAGFYTSAQTLSPKTTSCALMPTWSTLQSLILMGYQSWEGQLIETDGSLMDFSGFASLRSLSVIHIYCFLSGDGIQLSERSGFHRRLPSSLEALQVHFSGDGKGSLRLGRPKDPSYPEENHKWLSELAEEKANSLPHLISVEMREDLCDDCNNFTQWHDFHNIGPAFEAANICLEVWLRCRRETYGRKRRD